MTDAALTRLTDDQLARFMRKVVKASDECWIWSGSKTNGNGPRYGQFSINHRNYVAHRVSYTHFHGSIPAGMTIDHICRVGLCVNPEHLRVMSLRDNILLGTGPSAANVKKTHCPKGHPYAGANLKLGVNRRYCRTCVNERTRLAYWRQKQEVR